MHDGIAPKKNDNRGQADSKEDKKNEFVLNVREYDKLSAFVFHYVIIPFFCELLPYFTMINNCNITIVLNQWFFQKLAM